MAGEQSAFLARRRASTGVSPGRVPVMAQPDDLEIRDFRQATTSSFNAMRADLTDLRTRVGDGFAQVDRGLTEMRGKLDATAAGQQQIVHLLNTLIAQQRGQPNGQ